MSLNSYSLSNPGTSIAIAPPLPRSDPAWYSANLPVFSTFLFHEVARMGNPQLKYMAPFVAPHSFYESDGVHLNSEAGASFISYLVTSADLLFPESEVQPLSASGTSDPVAETSSGFSSSVSLSQLSQDVTSLRSEVRRHRCQDNLVFARIKEDRDVEINKASEDRCTITGLNVSTAPPSDPKERKEFFKTLVSGLVSEALPEASPQPQVLDVLVNMRYGRGPPVFEVKFDSVASSAAFRIAASKLAKDGIGSFQGVFISNTVNLSTRIRIDIMKLIAKRLTTSSEYSYVQGFSSRPTLHYSMKAVDPELGIPPPPPATGTGRSYTFSEAVERWGDLLTRHSLEGIRRKALQAFSGCLEQYFVVLSDRLPEFEPDIFSRLLPQSTSGFQTSFRGRRPQSSGRYQRSYRGQSQPRGASSVPRSQQASSSSAPQGRDPSQKRGPPSDADDDEPSKKK